MKQIYLKILKNCFLLILILVYTSFVSGCLNNNPEELYEKGLALKSQGKSKEAMQYFDKAVQIDPDNSDYWSTIGNTVMFIDKNKALKVFNKVIQLDPENENAWNGKLQILEEQNKNEEIIKTIDKMLEIKPWSYDSIMNNVVSNNYLRRKTEALIRLEKYEAALEIINYLTVSAANTSGRVDPWILKVDVLNKLGRYAEADEAQETLSSFQGKMFLIE